MIPLPLFNLPRVLEYSYCFRRNESDTYSDAFSGSAGAADEAPSPASLVSVVAAPLSPPLGSASDEVHRVWSILAVSAKNGFSEDLPGYLSEAAL